MPISLNTSDKMLSLREVEVSRARRLEATALQAIENNPLSEEDIALFEMFERQRWAYDTRREYLLGVAHQDAPQLPPVSGDDQYLYPETSVLRNRFGIVSATRLDMHERRLVTNRIAEGSPTGTFDLAHLCAIHRHLFQDVFDWAGEVRVLEISKDGDQFMFRQFIGTGMADIHKRLVEGKYLRDLTPEAFAQAAGAILGDVNYVHPFRDGNGRTQLQYLKLLATCAGQDIDLTLFDGARWIAASRAANKAEYGPMCDEIRAALKVSEEDRP